MAWVKLDTHWYEDESIEAAAEQAGPMVFAVWPVVLAMAKAQNDGGKVKLSYRRFSDALFSDWETIAPALEALASAGVLSCPQASERSAKVAIDPESWRRWNEAARKAEERAAKRELAAA